MEIGQRSPYPAGLGSSAVSASQPRRMGERTGYGAAHVAAADFAHLSPAANVAAEAAQMPEVRQDRIAGLQQRLASGTYAVDPQQVADAMLRDAGSAF